MEFINEPGLEGNATLSPDIRIDFYFGAVNQLSFGFATSTGATGPLNTATISLYDATNSLLGTTIGEAMPSTIGSYPEAIVTANFTGIASYALVDFSGGSRFIIDNFEGTFGSTEDITPGNPVPEPTTMLLFGFGLLGIARIGRKRP